MKNARNPVPDFNRRVIRIAFGAMALASALTGLVVWQFADALGLQEDTARIVATAFAVAGIADVVVLHFWDRLFKGGS